MGAGPSRALSIFHLLPVQEYPQACRDSDEYPAWRRGNYEAMIRNATCGHSNRSHYAQQSDYDLLKDHSKWTT